MLTEEQVRHYIEGLLVPESSILKDISLMTSQLGFEHEEVFPSQVALFQTLTLMRQTKRILELGTFLGYSTAGFAEAIRDSSPEAHITTVEKDPNRSAEAQQLLEKSGLASYITFIVGDDQTTCIELKKNQQEFDLIFLDSAEINYPKLFPLCIDLLEPRGLLIVDNVLMPWVRGWANTHNVIETIDQPDLIALRELLHQASNDKRIKSAIIPMGSGLLLSTKL